MAAWVKIVLVSLLMIATFRFNLVRLWLKTNPFFGEPNWRHAICVPLIGLYYLFVNRDELLQGPVKPFLWGRVNRPGRLWVSLALLAVGGAVVLVDAVSTNFANSIVVSLAYGACAFGLALLAFDWTLAILLFGLFVFTYGIWPGQNDYLKDLGMVITLFGVTALLAGWRVMKVAWFPIAFLVCALPWPELVYSKIAWPLQQLAASVAVGTLRFTGVNATNSGTKIIMDTGRSIGSVSVMRTLNVAEACAGLRSLMTFISVGAAVAFLSARPLWQKILITLSAIPIAILCNVMRVSGQGILDHYCSQEWSEGFAHQFAGMMMLIPGFFLLLLVGWLLDKIFIEEADPDVAPAPAVAPGKKVNWSLPGESLKAEPSNIAAAPAATPATPTTPVPQSAKAAQPARAKEARPAAIPARNAAALPAVSPPPPRQGNPATAMTPNGTVGTASAKPSAGPSALKPATRGLIPPNQQSLKPKAAAAPPSAGLPPIVKSSGASRPADSQPQRPNATNHSKEGA